MSTIERQVTLRLVPGHEVYRAYIEVNKRVLLAVLVDGNFGTETPEWRVYHPGPDAYNYSGFTREPFLTAEAAAEAFFKFMELP